MRLTHFNIHGLISATLEADAPDTAHYLAEFEYYRTDELVEADQHIHVVIGEIDENAGRKGVAVNKKFRVTDHSIYASDSHKVAKWEVLIEGIDQPKTVVRLHGNRFARIVWPRWFLETIIRLKLQSKGFAMVHSSSLCAREGGNVLAASPSTGKTSLLLDWLGSGKPFSNDEYSIFQNGKLYSYVTPFRFHAHNLKGNPVFLADMSKADRRQIVARSALLKLSGGYADVTWKTSMQSVFPSTEILSETPLTGIFVMTKTSEPEVRIAEGNAAAVSRKLSILNQFEWFGFGPYLEAWAYGNPESWVATRRDAEMKIFEKELSMTRHGEIFVPPRIGRAEARDIYRYLGVTAA